MTKHHHDAALNETDELEFDWAYVGLFFWPAMSTLCFLLFLHVFQFTHDHSLAGAIVAGLLISGLVYELLSCIRPRHNDIPVDETGEVRQTRVRRFLRGQSYGIKAVLLIGLVLGLVLAFDRGTKLLF